VARAGIEPATHGFSVCALPTEIITYFIDSSRYE
jgi:hypothetical protein